VCHVKKVLDVLQKEKFYFKIYNCKFGKTYLVCLGHIVGGVKLKIDPYKIDVIVKCYKPTKVTEVCSFLGAIQYWRRSIPNFSIIASPLHALTSVKQIFKWGGKQQKLFDALKENINIALVSALPDVQ